MKHVTTTPHHHHVDSDMVTIDSL